LELFDWDYFLAGPEAIMMDQEPGLTTPADPAPSPVLTEPNSSKKTLKATASRKRHASDPIIQRAPSSFHKKAVNEKAKVGPSVSRIKSTTPRVIASVSRRARPGQSTPNLGGQGKKRDSPDDIAESSGELKQRPKKRRTHTKVGTESNQAPGAHSRLSSPIPVPDTPPPVIEGIIGI
jgi:hypothetical protein